MVPKSLFAGQQWRNRHREQTYGRGERRGPSPGNLPDPEIEPASPALTNGFFTAKSPGKC